MGARRGRWEGFLGREGERRREVDDRARHKSNLTVANARTETAFLHAPSFDHLIPHPISLPPQRLPPPPDTGSAAALPPGNVHTHTPRAYTLRAEDEREDVDQARASRQDWLTLTASLEYSKHRWRYYSSSRHASSMLHTCLRMCFLHTCTVTASQSDGALSLAPTWSIGLPSVATAWTAL